MTQGQITLAAQPPKQDPHPEANPASPRRPARYAAPAEVWGRVRADYLGGLSAPDCCRRHGVGLSALRDRAGREGWRRADQPWVSPAARHPDIRHPDIRHSASLKTATLPACVTGSRALTSERAATMDGVEPAQVSRVAHRHMIQAVMEGDAALALRWRRLARGMDQDQAAADDASDQLALLASLTTRGGSPDRPDASDVSDASDG